MTQPASPQALPSHAPGFSLSRISWDWLGVVPFFLFAILFLILPTAFLVVGAFQDAEGHFTLRNIANLTQPSIVAAYWISIKVSAASAIVGGFFGFLIAYAAIAGGVPGWIRPTLMTFSGVASNFAGVPLAFAFLATLGRTGLLTVLLINPFCRLVRVARPFSAAEILCVFVMGLVSSGVSTIGLASEIIPLAGSLFNQIGRAHV